MRRPCRELSMVPGAQQALPSLGSLLKGLPAAFPDHPRARPWTLSNAIFILVSDMDHSASIHGCHQQAQTRQKPRLPWSLQWSTVPRTLSAGTCHVRPSAHAQAQNSSLVNSSQYVLQNK